MNDNTGQGVSSCLAITEKKNQRPSGCIGILFQLFDWNRRLTKKRLFSKKLLSPAARAKQASSKKFKGDEKMPNSKLHLIANENNGGFPSAKKGGNSVKGVEQKHEMRVPSLVARLMGLESIPALQKDKSKKASISDTCGDEKETLGDNNCEVEKQVVDMEMGVAKHDSRPQKLQKTETCERRTMTRFGAEALQIKGVLSKAKKYNHHHHHHHKLATPLKGPRISSGKSTSRSSRLIGAATKILEPGLQATSRAKCALSSSASIYPPENGTMIERVGTWSANSQNQSSFYAGTAKSLMGHTSCQNCGNLLDVVDGRPEVEKLPEIPPPIVSDVSPESSLVSAQNKRSFMPCHENDIVVLRSQEKLITVANEEEGKSNALSYSKSTGRRMPLFCEDPAELDSSCQPCRTIGYGVSCSGFKDKYQIEQLLSGEKISTGSRTSNLQVKRASSAASTVNGTKDFVALNRNLSGQTRMRSPTKVDGSKFDLDSGQTRMRSPTKVDGSKFDLDRKPCKRQDDPFSRASTLERKRRTANVSRVEGSASVNSVTAKQINLSSEANRGKRRDVSAPSPNRSNVKSKRVGQQIKDKAMENKVASFTFNSPIKQKIALLAGKEERRSDNEIKTYLQRSLPFRADGLGTFLKEKLKELSSPDEKLATGGPSKKSPAMILQELISALRSENLTYTDDHMFNDKYGANQEMLLGTSSDGNHRSPGSVLEASFSSSSLDESSGHRFHPDSMNCSYNHMEQLEHDIELLDSATSYNKGQIGCKILTDAVKQIPWILQSLNSFGTRLTKGELTHMKEVILNAELVLGNATEHSEDGVPQLLISCFLLDELDSMAGDAMWTCINGNVAFEDPKERSQLKGFLFDCVIEYIESHCCQYYNSVFKSWSAWTEVPLCMKAEMLVQEVKREINEWSCLAGMAHDEIIEWDMSHSLGKWTDFNVDAFEAGVDIGGDVLYTLVDEIVKDLVDSRQRFI